MSEPISKHLLSDIADRDAQTEPQTVAHLLPLGRSGSKYDHARRQTSDYHLDSDELAMGDRHALLDEVRRQRMVLAGLRAKVEREPLYDANDRIVAMNGTTREPTTMADAVEAYRTRVLALLDAEKP